ncbi:hypothetical protein PPTG_21477 [Phytophthora nicotianae INRA-310]|uniref:Uncharacterized protein n=1 Tax=Phytophthora nicotianae (strain INRA-310) TaxID=761204 RepID=W2R4H2_PHYN3|nr:hypothetical protein PPTG_21477 [Phytophthora nicotianae INRA-310]ETN19624.1 hypothetical protein PPTG_21477 [Phytophthora nicotianae INRA-310]
MLRESYAYSTSYVGPRYTTPIIEEGDDNAKTF